MKKLILTIVFAVLYLVTGTSSVLAVANTSSDTDPGQVRTARNDDGTVYLTTAVNGENSPTQSGNTTAISSRPASARVTGEAVTQPEGFAGDLGSYINSILGIVMVVSLLLVFFNFIQAGFQWITSGGDKGKTEEARNRIVNAFVGILIVSSSFALLGFVAYILGFES
ncbi:MAG: hypothetical protein QG639_230, partial [Patescibacteria group bacterium]|nr:hypothetical protein [Patescibacteria group bacterium]